MDLGWDFICTSTSIKGWNIFYLMWKDSNNLFFLKKKTGENIFPFNNNTDEDTYEGLERCR